MISTPPAPRQPFDPDFPRCRTHRDVPPGELPSCGACAEARRWVETRREQTDLEARARIRGCEMCDAAGVRWDLAVTCDHAASPEAVVAELDERDHRAEQAAAERAARLRAARAAVPSTPEGRAHAAKLYAGRA